MQTLAKDTRLHIRCDQEVLRLLYKAAAYAHMSVSEFVLRNAVDQAQSVVQAHEAMTVSQDDFAAFLDALDAPAQPNSTQRCNVHSSVTPSTCSKWSMSFVRWTAVR
jgi:uncharacterized protein (DUF1778 family)